MLTTDCEVVTFPRRMIKETCDIHGAQLKTYIAMEEMGELIQALSKQMRGEGDILNLTEEIGDVMLMMAQMCYIHGINIEDVQRYIDYKIVRQAARDIKGKDVSEHCTA